VNAADATAGNENVISNNFIYSFVGGAGTGAQNGILINSSDSVKVFYNSILLDDAGASCNCPARGIYVQNATVNGLEFRNNVLSVSRGGTGEKQAIYFEPATVSGYTINHNDYYLNASSGTQELVHMGSTGYTTLAAWQAAKAAIAKAMRSRSKTFSA
jgi:hypothetical protein